MKNLKNVNEEYLNVIQKMFQNIPEHFVLTIHEVEHFTGAKHKISCTVCFSLMSCAVKNLKNVNEEYLNVIQKMFQNIPEHFVLTIHEVEHFTGAKHKISCTVCFSLMSCAVKKPEKCKRRIFEHHTKNVSEHSRTFRCDNT